MGLITARSYASPHRLGRTKQLEQVGDWKALLEYTAKLSEAHGDHEEATRLRAQLARQSQPAPLYTQEPEALEPPKPKARRIRNKPKPSTHQQKVDQAWEELRRRRGVSE